MVRPTRPALAAVAALVLQSTGMPANAQEVQQQAPAVEYEEEDLRAFAQASLRVQQLNDEWAPRLSAADSEAEAAQLRADVASEMAQAVRDEGLSVQDYNAIYDQALRNPELTNQIQAYQRDAQ